MLKFLRQYNQWILVVGGTLLLITFLMPTAIQNCAQQSAVSGAVWATYAGGKEVKGADLEQAQQELRVLELAGDSLLRQLKADKDPAHWWLLAHEAMESGLVGGLGDGEAVVAQLAASRAKLAETNPNVRGTTVDSMLSELMQGSRASRDVALMALAKLNGVSRLVNLASNVDRVSDVRLEHTAAESMLGVTGDLFVIDARKALSIEVPAADDAALDAHFKKFAEKAAPAVGSPAGKENFGYRLPDRFKLEWITIPKATVEASVANAPELQTLALKKRFAQDPARFGAPADGSGSFATFEQAVRKTVMDDLVKARLDAASKFATDQLALAQRSLKRDGAYFDLPADWSSSMPSFASIAESVAAEFNLPTPSIGSTGENWMTVAELEGVRGGELGLSMLSTDRFGSTVQLARVIAGAKELSSPNLNQPFQANIASPPFTSSTGDVTFVRLLAADASKPATELALVRDAVTADLTAISKYEWLEKNEQAIAQEVATQGLRTVAAKYGADVQFAKALRAANPQFIEYGVRIPSPIPGLGNDADAMDALVAKAIRLPLTKDLSTMPAAERTFVVAAPDRLSLVVMEVSALEPLTAERYAQLAANPQSVGIVRDPDFIQNPTEIFSFDALAKRYDFKLSRLESDEAEAAAEVAAEIKAG
jgi:hypothetical protein